MRIGINWIFGNPVGPTAPQIVDPAHAAWLTSVTEGITAGSVTGVPEMPAGLALAAKMNNPAYAPLGNILISAIVLVSILLIARFGRGFIANISVLLGIVIGGLIAIVTGAMTFTKVGEAAWFGLITPFHFGMPTFDPVMIVTMTLVMIVVMIESTGMFLALGDMTGRKVDQPMLSAGLRTDGLGTLIGGIFNTFPYTSFSQNVGLVGVTGVRSRFVCVAGGIILILLGLVPKMGALIESLPTMVLGGAGIVMFGMVAATGIRILAGVDFARNRNNLFIVAVSLGFGMIPLLAPNFKMWMPHDIHPLIESGILLASVAAVALNAFFNGAKLNEAEIKAAASAADH
jgi:NCS2 family nucleobase:cation symporter-2